jgi:beta-galactosidase
MDFHDFQLGAPYYPEHWPEGQWAKDARWMRELGLTVTRMAEFAWTLLEPEEGAFDWGWLDRGIETFAAEGFKILLGTPTAAPPMWLSQRYPETLPVDDQSRRRRPGGRRHYCPNSPDYQRLTRAIVRAMAERYGGHPAIVGWQIDNEFGGSGSARCYCEQCAAAFRVWLRDRYGTLDALNARWGAVFWSQIYRAWDQIQPPILTNNAPNPAHQLDYWRFMSDSFVRYQQLQVDVLRAAAPGQALTTNLMGLFTPINYWKLAASLDFVSWDSYPTGYSHDRWGPQTRTPGDPLPPYAWDVGDAAIFGLAHDLMRSLKPGAPVWIMEQQPGMINWGSINPVIRPGTPRLWCWHAVASGASGIIFFRERAARPAQENYHTGLLKHDGTPDLGYHEVAALQTEREQLQAVARAPLTAEVALVYDYDDLWALQIQPHRKDFIYQRLVFVWYAALQQAGIQVDLVPGDRDVSGYKLVIAPCAHLADEAQAARWQAYVEAGGALVLGIRSGVKTRDNAFTDAWLPGPFRPLTGARVLHWGPLPDGVRFGLDSAVDGLAGPGAGFWVEALQLSGDRFTRALASYTDGPWAGAAAISERRSGPGTCTYVGLWPTRAQADALVRRWAEALGLTRVADLPSGVVATRRGAQTIVLNFTEQEQIVRVGEQVRRVAARGVDLV